MTNSYSGTSPKAPKKDGNGQVEKVATVIKTSPTEGSERLPKPAVTPRGENSAKDKTQSGKRISRKKVQALVDNETASSEQTVKAAPPIRSDKKVTKNGLEEPFVKVPSQSPPVSQQGHNDSTEGNKKPLKRKEVPTFEDGSGHTKRRKGDGSATSGKEGGWENARPTLADTPKPASITGHDDPNVTNREIATREAEPRGLCNEANACYINSILQAIANVPRMVNHYRGLANNLIPEVADFVALNAKHLEGDVGTFYPSKVTSRVRRELKELLVENKSKM